jgi:mono/diheme cytochrome c family protein
MIFPGPEKLLTVNRFSSRLAGGLGISLCLRAVPATKTFCGERKKAIMKMTKLVILIVMIALALFLILPNLSWAADDGAAIYKAKCAACHGADLAGKPAAKFPSLVSDDAKKASDADLTDAIANGGKEKKAMHAFANKGVTPDQVKMVVSYIREAQKK